MKFYLGTHKAGWAEKVDFRLFMSHRMLRIRVRLPVARGPWSLDSGGFSELTQYGTWRTGLAEYVEAVERYSEHMGHLEWAAPQDWMCEPHMLALTGLSVEEHQHRTIGNYLSLREEAPHLPFIPVLQGWQLEDYVRCVELYEQAGVQLVELPLVGVGSVCRRQGTEPIEQIFRELHDMGLSCHGFGVKADGLKRYARHLTSADSMAWSYTARYREPLPGCTHRRCNNCLRYARRWRNQVIRSYRA